ncbi:MAG: S-methyl-5'-thioadenosine phosphorylase [Anaerolineae bacterium]
MSDPKALIGVIGGSGLYHMPDLTDVEEIRVETPFGSPSDAVSVGTLSGQRVAFLPRHGRGHRLTPGELPVRANIWALKSLGVRHLIAVSAVGSLRRKIKPLDIVIPDQIFDRTKSRPGSFFENGIVAHVGIADPFCGAMRRALYLASKDAADTKVHDGGTMVVIEGPQFSTKAESRFYRTLGFDIIGMTAIPEAKLAREAEMDYAVLAMVTDYDVWHESEAPVTAEIVIRNLNQNVATAQRVLKAVLPRVAELKCDAGCSDALGSAIATSPDAITAEVRQRLGLFLDKYFPPAGPVGASGQG